MNNEWVDSKLRDYIRGDSHELPDSVNAKIDRALASLKASNPKPVRTLKVKRRIIAASVVSVGVIALSYYTSAVWAQIKEVPAVQ